MKRAKSPFKWWGGWKIPSRVAMGFALVVGCAGNMEDSDQNPATGTGKTTIPGMNPGTGLPDPMNPGMTPVTPSPGKVDPAMTITPEPGEPPRMLSPDRAAIPYCKAFDPGPSYMRRLNKREYELTTVSLLQLDGNDPKPARDFPSEEQRLGFDNNAETISVSPLLAEGYLAGAERLASLVVERYAAAGAPAGTANTYVTRVLGGCDPATMPEETCWTRFITSFVKRAYRRPVTTEEVAILRTVYDVGRMQDFKTGIKMALTTVLQSPQFLYRIELGGGVKPGEAHVALTQYELATRLGFMLWGRPDFDGLMPLADTGKLTPDVLKIQIDRMLTAPVAVGQMAPAMPGPEPKARAQFSHFMEQWVETEKVVEVQKDIKVFPSATFPVAMLGWMKTEVDRFLDMAFWSSPAGGGTLTSMYTAPFTVANLELFNYYKLMGMAPAKAAMGVNQFEVVKLEGNQRGGLLTQGALMAVQANANQSSPVKRGAFVRERLLCQHLAPPPPNLMIELPAIKPNQTTRERFTVHMENPACSGCHRLMDPVGLAFENFDSIGKWRDTDGGKAVDNSGELTDWKDGKFKGPVELGKKLAASDQAASCAVQQMFRFAYGREEELTGDPKKPGMDDCSVEMLKRKFVASGLKWRDLVVALAETDTFLYRRASELGGTK